MAEEELTRALAKVARLKKTLKHTKSKVAEKALCLASELADDNDGVSEDGQDSLFADLPSDFWQLSTPPVVETSSAVAGSFLNS